MTLIYTANFAALYAVTYYVKPKPAKVLLKSAIDLNYFQSPGQLPNSTVFLIFKKIQNTKKHLVAILYPCSRAISFAEGWIFCLKSFSAKTKNK